MASRLSGNRLFLDSAYAIALAAPADEHHQTARSLANEVLGSRIGIITTREVMFEVANALCKPRYRSAAVATLKAFETDPLIEIVERTAELYRAAFDLFERRMDKEWSLTDCLSFVVMHQNGLTEALTSDEHFEQAGFKALLRQPTD